MSDFINGSVVRLDLYRILTGVMRKIFEGSMNTSILYLFLFALKHLRFQSCLFTLVLKILLYCSELQLK
jgi:hypothetical protein